MSSYSHTSLDGEALLEGDRDGDSDGEALALGLSDDDSEGDALADGEMEGLALLDGLRLALGDSDGLTEDDGDNDGDALLDGERDGLSLLLGDNEGLTELDGDKLAEGDTDGDALAPTGLMATRNPCLKDVLTFVVRCLSPVTPALAWAASATIAPRSSRLQEATSVIPAACVISGPPVDTALPQARSNALATVVVMDAA